MPGARDPVAAAETLLKVTAAFRPIVESSAGYRDLCLAEGFTPAAAERMAVDYHRQLIIRAFEKPT